MALATIASTAPVIIQILNANRVAYSASVGTGANQLGAYKFDQEITDALLRADGHIITEGYFKSKESLRKRFFQVSVNLATGDQLPEFDGFIGKAQYSLDQLVWRTSVEVPRDDILGATQVGGYVGTANIFNGQHFIDEEQGVVYHASPYFRIEYPFYTRTAALQCLQNHEPAIIAWALVFLYKDRSNTNFPHYSELAQFLLQSIRAGRMKMSSYMPGAIEGGA